MFVTNHALAGALLGTVAPGRPAAAFLVAAASHLAMDRVPHWGLSTPRELDPAGFLRVAVRDGLLGLGVVGATAALAPRSHRAAVVAGMAGAVLLDVDKPAELLGLHPVPGPVQRLHVALQREHERHLGREVALGSLMAIALGTTLVSRRRRPAPRHAEPGLPAARSREEADARPPRRRRAPPRP